MNLQCFDTIKLLYDLRAACNGYRFTKCSKYSIENKLFYRNYNFFFFIPKSRSFGLNKELLKNIGNVSFCKNIHIKLGKNKY